MMLTATAPRHLSFAEVKLAISDRLTGAEVGTPIPDGDALAIASWYASPTDGRAFAQLATTGAADSADLLTDLATAARQVNTDTGRMLELIALLGWITSHTE